MKEMIQPPSAQSAGPVPQDLPVAVPRAGGGIDLVKLKQYLHVIVRRIWIVAVCFTVAMVAAIAKVSKQEAVYQSNTSLLLTRGTPQLIKQMTKTDQDQLIGDFVETQLRIMQSRGVLQRAREQLTLPAPEVGRLLRGFQVWPVGRSSLVNLQVQALDPQLAADYANAIVRSYIEFKEQEKSGGIQSSVITLTQQANKIRDELRKAEDALVQFKKENSFVISAAGKNLAVEMMVSLSARASGYRLERMILETQKPLLNDVSDDVVLTALSSRYRVPEAPYQSDYASSSESMEQVEGVQKIGSQGMSPLGIVDFSGSEQEAWGSLKRRKSILEHELRSVRESLRDSHPSVQRLIKELGEVEASLEREVRFATERYYTQLEALVLKESALARVESMWLEEALETEITADRYSNLVGDAERLKSFLNTALNRIRDADITEGISSDMVTVLEEAVPPGGPVTPRKLQSIFTAGLLGVLIGVGIIFGLDFLDDSLRYPEDVAKHLGLNFFGLVPSANWSSSDIRTHLLSQIDPKSGLAESYRNIRAALMQQKFTRNSKTLLVTSALPKEGKTTTSLNISISFAQAGQRVLIVDADLRRGEVHKYFGLEGGRGLADVLAGQAKTESVIQRTGVANLDLIATGPFPANPAELFLRPEFRTFMEYASRSYDKIIFDGPPVMAVSESAVLASMVESTVLIVWAGHTSRKLCQIALQNLLQRGARVDGCILNNLEFGRVGYYYYSTYYGYYTYDYKYDDAARPG